MKTSHLVRLAILVVTISTLSGCLWVPVDDGYGGGGHDRGRGGSHGERGGERGGDHGERH